VKLFGNVKMTFEKSSILVTNSFTLVSFMLLGSIVFVHIVNDSVTNFNIFLSFILNV